MSGEAITDGLRNIKLKIMNNHHDIVYVPNESGQFFVKTILSGTKVSCLKDVFVFTKEELDKRDSENYDRGYDEGYSHCLCN